MTAVKPREPGTFFGAITHINDTIGAKRAAAAVEVGASTLYQWADPDQPNKRPSLDQAVAIDIAMMRETGETPILSVYIEKVEAARCEHQAMALAERLLCHSERMGDAIGEYHTAKTPHSPGGAAVTPAEAARIATKFDAVIEALLSAKRDVLAEAGCVRVPINGVVK